MVPKSADILIINDGLVKWLDQEEAGQSVEPGELNWVDYISN